MLTNAGPEACAASGEPGAPLEDMEDTAEAVVVWVGLEAVTLDCVAAGLIGHRGPGAKAGWEAAGGT